jgi:hypothetical protein
MREIRTYGATSGDWKRSYDEWIEAPASPENGHSPLSAATAPVIDSTRGLTGKNDPQPTLRVIASWC